MLEAVPEARLPQWKFLDAVDTSGEYYEKVEELELCEECGGVSRCW